MRTRHLAPLAIGVALSLALVPLASASGAGSPDRERAAAPIVKVSGWTRLSSGDVSSLSEPHALPLGSGGSQVIWYQQDTASSESIRTRVVNERGRPATDVLAVVKNWAGVISDPKIIDHGNERMVVFAGIRSTNPGEIYDGPMAYATSTDGKSWSLGNGSLSETGYAYASYGTAAVDDAGTPLIGVVASSTSFVTLHRGISPTVPASSGDWQTVSLSGNTYDASLGRDSATGRTWAVWIQDFGNKAQKGVIAQKVYPTPLGDWQKAPKSTRKNGDFLAPDQGVAVASRVGGEVWAAYKVGYPTANQIALWRVGSKEVMTVRAPDVDRITLQPAPNGRLWLAWYSGTSTKIKVTRTNSAVTRFGEVRSLKPPTKKGSYSNVWEMGGSGRGGPLHLVVNAQIGVSEPQIWYQKVLPGLRLVLSPRTLNRGRVVATVTDAGSPVTNAKVKFLGSSKATNGQGKVTFKVGGGVKDGKYKAVATKAGYARGHGVVTVT